MKKQTYLRANLVLMCIISLVLQLVAKGEGEPVPAKEKLALCSFDSIFRLADKYTFEDLTQAISITDIALEKAQNEQHDKGAFDAYRLRGMMYEDNKNNTKALEQYFLAAQIATKIGYFEQNIAYTDIAIAYRKEGQYQSSQEYHTKALHVALQSNDNENIEYSYHGLATLYSTADDFDNAIKNYYKSLEYAEMRNNTRGIIISLRNISDNYRRMRDNRQSLSTIERAYQLALKSDELDIRIDVIGSYSAVLADLNNMNEAFAKLDEALQYANKSNKYEKERYKLLMIKGELFVRQGRFAEAEATFEECLKDKELMGTYSLSKINFELGNIYFNKKDNKSAIVRINESLQIADEFDYILVSEMGHRKLYEIYKSQHQLSDALSHFEKANILRDSIFNQEKTKRVAELQFRYQLEKSDKEIQSLKLRENNYVLYASILAFGIALIFMIYIMRMRDRNYKALKKQTDEIESQNRKLEETNQVLHQFAYASAHDLKEPLRNIGSFVSLIQRRYTGQLPEEAIEYMGYVTGGVKKMNRLLEDLLHYSTLTMNGKEIERESVNLDEIVREVTENLQSTITQKQAQVVFPDTMPKVYMSRLHTTQLFQNLVSNALKFVEDGPIVKIESKENANDVTISISDNGIGIKKEYGEKIFNLFQRLHKNDKRFEGTGVGLAICKNIVDKYNGKIWFESVENQGTTFYINLPKIAA